MKRILICLLAVGIAPLFAAAELPAQAGIDDAGVFRIDIGKAANMGFADSVANDRQGGWTDQGPENDLSGFPVGEQMFAGIPFLIADPEQNRGNGCLVLRGTARPYFPEEISVELAKPSAAKYLYILNATAWNSSAKTGEVIVEYARGDLVATETNTFTLYGNKETGNFWGVLPLPAAEIGWKGNNASSTVGLYLTCFELSERPISKITFRSAGNMVWLIAGATLSNRPPRTSARESRELKAGEDWIPMPASFGIKPGSVLDFSGLQDAPAGKYGFLKAMNGHFEFTNRPGKPVRFYGLNIVGDVHFMEKGEIDEIADELAASGYNLVRFHHFDNRMRVKGQKSTVIDAARQERLDYWIATLKSRGIYVSLDLFTSRNPDKGEIPEYPERKLSVGEYKALYPLNAGVRTNWEEFSANLLNHVNPYTGLAWKEEPAIAQISLLNENTIHAVYDLNPFIRKQYDEKFEAWLSGRRESGHGREVLYEVFLQETYLAAYRELQAAVQRLGIKVPVSDQNFWMKVPLTIMRNHYDYVDNHLYWSHPSYRNPKQRFSPPFIVENTNAVRLFGGTLPRRFPTKIYGKPFSMSEWNHCVPSAFNMQGVFLIGAYGSYQNWDSLCRFAYSHRAENIRNRQPMRRPFDLAADPVSMLSDRVGICFFLRGDVRSAGIQYPILVDGNPTKNGAPDYPAGAERIGFVGGTGSIVINGKTEPVVPANVPAFLGLVPDLKKFREKPVFNARENSLLQNMQSRKALSASAFQPEQNEFRSDTGEILLETNRNRFSVITPRSEGFLLDKDDKGCGKFIKISNRYAYAGFLVAAVDGKPLISSSRMLLLHLPDHKSTGMRFRDEDLSFLEDWGTLPLLVARGEAEVTVQRDLSAFQLYAVDGDGSRLGTVPMRHASGESNFILSTEWNGRAIVAYELVKK